MKKKSKAQMRGKGKHTLFSSVLRIAAVIGGGVLCLSLLLAVSVLYAADAEEVRVPTLFYNDSVWEGERGYPAEGFVRGGRQDFWIPLSFFESMENVKIKRGAGNTLNYFVISDTATGRYLSFDAQSEYVQTERGTLLILKTLFMRKERYLPMRDVCAYFGWSFEFETTDAYSAVRITDGGETLTFAALLLPYLPETETETPEPPPVVTEPPAVKPPVVTETETESETEAPEPPPVVTEPVTEPPVPPEPPETFRAETVFLTFEGIEPEKTARIARLLAEYEAHAAFFVTGEELLAYPETVTALLVAGHSVGLRTMSGDAETLTDVDAVLASLAEENELFYQLTKRKLRLARLPEGTHTGTLHLSAEEKQKIEDAGYSLWDWNVAAMDHSWAYTADMVYEKVKNGLRSIRNPVVRFRCTDHAAEALERLLRLIETVPAMTAERISDADTGVVFP